MGSTLRVWGIGTGKLVAFLLSLDIFFVAIKLLGAFKSLGSGYGEVLIQNLAQNPFMGLVIGILVTSIIQSSSTTTAITVGLVAAGVLGDDPAKALAMAIPIIMGANIGTSITAMLVSLGHMGNRIEFRRAIGASFLHDLFNWLTVLLVLPLQIATNFLGHGALFLANLLDDVGGLKFTSPIKYLVGPQIDLIKGWFKHSDTLVQFVVVMFLAFAVFEGVSYLAKRVNKGKRTIGFSIILAVASAGMVAFVTNFHEFVFHHTAAIFITGLGLLFVALWGMVTIMRSVVLDKVQTLFNDVIFKTGLRAMALGIVLTALVQSSSVTTSLIVPLAGAGLLNLFQVLPYVMGANIGTTVTAMLAALSLGEVTGVAAAFAHLLFNICGIAVFYPLAKFPVKLADGFAKLAQKSAAIPIGLIVVMYILLPIACVAIFR